MKKFLFRPSKLYGYLTRRLLASIEGFTANFSDGRQFKDGDCESRMAEGTVGSHDLLSDISLPTDAGISFSATTQKNPSGLTLLKKACYGVGHVLVTTIPMKLFSLHPITKY